MATIEVKRKHGLEKKEAKKRVTKALKGMEGKVPGLSTEWESFTCRMTATGASGTITVTETHVEVAIDLALLMRPMKGMVQQMIDKSFADALEG